MKKTSAKSSRSKKAVSATTPETRGFNNSVMIPARPTFRRRLRSFYKHNTLVFYTMVGLFIMLLLMIAMGVASYFSETDVEQVEDKYWLRGELTSSRLFATFLEKSFGGKGVDSLQSVRFSGKILLDDTDQDFYLIKKRPNYAIFKADLRLGFELTYGINPELTWARLRIKNKEDKIYLVEEDEAERIQALAVFFSPFIEFVKEPNAKAISISTSEDLGEETIRIEFMNDARGCRSVAHLSGDSLHLLQRIDYLDNGSIVRTEYEDYREIEGYRFPFSTKVYNDDALSQRVVLNEITINPGVISGLFAIPEGLEEN